MRTEVKPKLGSFFTVRNQRAAQEAKKPPADSSKIGLVMEGKIGLKSLAREITKCEAISITGHVWLGERSNNPGTYEKHCNGSCGGNIHG